MRVYKASPMLFVQVSAVQLVYYISGDEDSHVWAQEFVTTFDTTHALGLQEVDVSFSTMFSMDDELAASSDRIVPYFSITYTVLITFACVSCSVLDHVRSKPLLGETPDFYLLKCQKKQALLSSLKSNSRPVIGKLGRGLFLPCESSGI